MDRTSAHQRSKRTPADRQAEVRRGIRTGLRVALGLAVVATIMMCIYAIVDARGQLFGWWFLALVFYGVFGVLGGALLGLLRPLARWYPGRVLIAYLLLLLVYGGGSTALYPLIALRPNPPPLVDLLVTGALLCVVLAPLYAATANSGTLARFWDEAGG